MLVYIFSHGKLLSLILSYSLTESWLQLLSLPLVSAISSLSTISLTLLNYWSRALFMLCWQPLPISPPLLPPHSSEPRYSGHKKRRKKRRKPTANANEPTATIQSVSTAHRGMCREIRHTVLVTNHCVMISLLVVCQMNWNYFQTLLTMHCL